MRQRYTIIIGVGVSTLMLVLVLASVDLERLRDAFAAAEYGYVFPAFGLLVIGHVTRAVRWRALLRGRLSLRHAFNILNVSYLFNGALPFRLGEVARIFLATQAGPPVPAFTTLSTILVERLLDLLSVLGMLGLVLAMLSVPAFITTAGLALGGGSLMGIGLLVALAHRPEWAFRLVALAERLLPVLARWSLRSTVARFLEGLQPLTSWRGVC